MCDYYPNDAYYELDDVLGECERCERHEKSQLKTADYLLQIMQVLYGKDKIDTAKLDDLFGEVCYIHDIQVPTSLPNIERKKPIDLDTWIEENNAYLKKLA